MNLKSCDEKVAVKTVAFVAVLWAVVHLLQVFILGIRVLYDSGIYLAAADHLRMHGYFESPDQVFYAIPIVLLAVFKSVSPDGVIPYVVLQSLLSGVSVMLLADAVLRVNRNQTAAFFAGILYLAWWDNIQWNTAILTESLLRSSICVGIWLLARFKGKRLNIFYLLLFSVSILSIRPTGMVVVVGIVAYLIAYYYDQISESRVRTAVVFGSILVVSFVGANAMFSMWNFSDQYQKGNIVTYADAVEGTKLYHNNLRVDTHSLRLANDDALPIWQVLSFVVYNPVHFFDTAARKVWYLMSGTRPYYSSRHNAFLLTWMAAIYVLGWVGWLRTKGHHIRYFIITAAVVNILLVAISTVDWDNRFYIPMEPGIIFLAASGAGKVFNQIKKSTAAQRSR